ncbi:MAG: DHH family phosphoesterase, partial [Rickettsiales bacterium]|nr:DHH family phosphoesterase [Rickettsiales bacterium]
MMDDLIENEIIFKSVCNRKWKKASYDQSRSLLIEQKKGVESIIAEMLSRRSLEYNDIDSFLEPKLRTSLPNPDIIKDMSVAVDTVYGAIKSKRKIAVFGDYDVDGATSSAVLKRFFRTIAVEVNIYIPDRVSEGYGPNINAFKELREQGVEIIITVDCGTAAHAVIEEGRNLGLDIIVLDHHISESPVLPSANAIVNPNRIDDNSGLNNLAAVGVTFLFVVALSKKIANQDLAVADNHSKKLLQLLDLVALGTVCDVVPLTGLNRAFVRQGLSIMSKTHNVGLK